MPSKICCIRGCNAKNVKLYIFPTQPQRLQLWLDIIKDPELDVMRFTTCNSSQNRKYPSFRGKYICGKHFTNNSFMTSEKKNLNRNAVPSLELPPIPYVSNSSSLNNSININIPENNKSIKNILDCTDVRLDMEVDPSNISVDFSSPIDINIFGLPDSSPPRLHSPDIKSFTIDLDLNVVETVSKLSGFGDATNQNDRPRMAKFPPDFQFGVATAAYQVEGAWNEDGRTESIWDYYTHQFPEKIIDRSNGDIACDAYHKISEDVNNLKQLKVNFYRFSISWTRILPTGFSNRVNEAGVKYYNTLINELLQNNIQPIITLYHWDLPQTFQQLGGWTNRKIVDYFAEYARICFQRFGDRVKTWITINEPMQISDLGYGVGSLAPFYKQDGIAPYMCSHNIILAHAKAYHIYDKEFRELQQGRIGITVEGGWYEPKSTSDKDVLAAERAMQMYFGWCIHPIFSKEGDYPEIMRTRIDSISKQQGFSESRLPRFTEEEVQNIKGTSDFLGLNHYITQYVENYHHSIDEPSYMGDKGVKYSLDDDWKQGAREVFKFVPWGLRKLLNWIKVKYDNPEVMITENGYAGFANESLNDLERIEYLNGYLEEILNSIHIDKCRVTAYTFWSFMDNYEWRDGYTMAFGLYQVDFTSKNRKRTPKRSAYVYQNIIVTRSVQKSLLPDKFLHQ